MTKAGDPKRPAADERDLAVARLEKALNDALERSRADEALIEDQRQRLKTLGLGREESMRALADAREELKRMTRERDELRKQLARLDSMQTETVTLPDFLAGLRLWRWARRMAGLPTGDVPADDGTEAHGA